MARDEGHSRSTSGDTRQRVRWRWPWVAIGGICLALLFASRVEITNPRIHVRWNTGLSNELRAARERRYDLRDGAVVDAATSTWQYRIGTLAQSNIRALVQDAAVADTGYIDRAAFTTTGRDFRVRWYPFSDLFNSPSQLRQLHQSLWLLLAGGVVLWAARSTSASVRRNTTVTALLFVGVMTVVVPLDPDTVTMGGSQARAANRDDFEFFYGERVRFEKHLSQVILQQLYRRDDSDDAPQHALLALTRLAAAWFILSALVIGVVERWSAVVVRYLGLALLAPAALLYFGWREFGYLSLSVAAFPLLVRGLRSDGLRLEAGAAVTGFGAVLHGTGIVALAGAWLAALRTEGRPMDQWRRVIRVTGWGTAAYLGWIAIYEIVLRLPISPDPGPVVFSSWRPWLVDEVRGGRVSAAIWSATGARDLLMTAWVVGVPLLFVAGSLWRRCTHEVRTALWYALPSLVFVTLRWPYDGVGGGMDLVVAGFPAMYALAWVCAQDATRTTSAAVILISGHYAFWRVVLDKAFIP